MPMNGAGLLPHFLRPPLTEFAISVQFEALTGFSFADIGPLRDHFRSDFPGIEYHPLLPPALETYGPQSTLIQFQFPFGPSLTIPRVWLIDEPGNKVLQFQTDRFVRNWRKTPANSTYPRYDVLRNEFVGQLASLSDLLLARGLGALVPTQCELTYVNQLPAPDGVAALYAHVFSNWRDIRPARLGPAEDVSLSQRFIVRDNDDAPVGRVYFQSGPRVDATGNPTVQLMMVGRGAPSTPSVEDAIGRLDMLHDRIVRSFTELMTPEIQAEWEFEK